MKLLTVVVGICIIANLAISTAIKFKNNGYHDVLVAISPDVEDNNEIKSKIVDNIKNWIESGSKHLYTASGKRAYIATVDILLPQSWTDIPEDKTTRSKFFSNAHIRVDLANEFYVDTPYTVQSYPACGRTGDYIHVTPDFLANLDGKTRKTMGTPGKVFVREWSKYKYGVFEEYGFPGDELYPMFYYDKSRKLIPNYCTDGRLEGAIVDQYTGDDCALDDESILSNKCVFRIDNDKNYHIHSSYMAVNFLPNVTEFCQPDENHDPYRPTRQNVICGGKSISEVILSHADFENTYAMSTDKPPKTEFNIIKPAESQRYVMVLDKSGSMGDDRKLEGLQEACKVFIESYIATGAYLGVVAFDSYAHEIYPIKPIEDGKDDRTNIIDAIFGLTAGSGTDIELGLEMGLEKLYGDDDEEKHFPGGVIMLLTDGLDSSDWITDEIEENIRNRTVTVMSVALGSKADPKLDNLSDISNSDPPCYVSVINIDTIEADIAACFEQSKKYDPDVPTSDKDILVYNQGFEGSSMAAEDTFVIDESIGNQLKIQLSYVLPKLTNSVLIVTNDNTTIVQKALDEDEKFAVITLDKILEAGDYKFEIITDEKKLDASCYVVIKISSKARDKDTQPFQTQCWTSIGNQQLDASKENLAIFARVSQGNNAVINATVNAYITRDGDEEPVELKLADNGRGADFMKEDGTYSGYFLDFKHKKGRYTLECEAKNVDKAVVIKSAKTKSLKLDRGFKEENYGPQSPTCCGSTTSNENITKVPTEKFQRSSTGGSFHVIKTPTFKDTIAPSRILDFKITTIAIPDSLLKILRAEFTSPGDDLDVGTASKYELRFVNTKTFNGSKIDFDDAEPIFDEDLLKPGLNLSYPLTGGEFVTLNFLSSKMNQTNTTYYFFIRAVDENGNNGEKSNPGMFCNDCEAPMTPPPSTTSTTTTTTSTSTTITTEAPTTKRNGAKPTDGPTNSKVSLATIITATVLAFALIVCTVYIVKTKFAKKLFNF